MRSLLSPYLSLLVTTLLVAAEARADNVFIPAVTISAQPLLSGSYWPGTFWRDTYWHASHTVTNPTDRHLTFRYVRVFGDRSARISDACHGSLVIPPNYSWGTSCAKPGGGPAFLEVDLDPGLILTGSIRFEALIGCGPPAQGGTTVASAPLPVYEGPFPAGATAASAELTTAGTFAPDERCPEPTIAPAQRRVNVTVLNASHEGAVVEVRAVGASAPPYQVSLAAGEVVQLNNVFAGYYHRVVLVTASQPFLCYASSVTTWSDPGRAPAIAVYPFRVLP